MYCNICGDENTSSARKFWSPDDGWKFAHLCEACDNDYGARQPHPDDYAYDRRSTDRKSVV